MWIAALPRAEKFAGAVDAEVLAGDFEAVRVFVDDFQPRFGEFASRASANRRTHTLSAASRPYPPA